MLDLHLDVEGRDAGKSNGNLVFMLLLFQTVFERLAWLGEGRRRLSVDTLLDDQGAEMLVAVVEIICQRRELVRVVASLGSVHGHSSLGQGRVEASLTERGGALQWLMLDFIFEVVWGRTCRQ